MVTPNQVLAFATLAGLVGVVAWTVYRSTRLVVDLSVREVFRTDDGLDLTVGLANEAGHTVALEEVSVTKVKSGPDAKGWVADVDDDARLPIEPGDELEGHVEIRCVGESVPDGAKLRVLFVFRGPQGPEMAETWVET